MRSIRRHYLVATGLAVVAGGFAVQTMLGGQAHGVAANPWAPTVAQIQVARQIAMQTATADNPAIPADTAKAASLDATAWPANVTDARVLATDRQAALSALGTPGAVNAADQRPVLLVQVTGTFQLRDVPTDPVAKPMPAFRYLQFVIDPVTGQSIDFGGDDTPADLSGGQSIFDK